MKIDVNVEFTVPQVVKILVAPKDALSYPISITLSKDDLDFGHHNVFPLLAIIWSKILVAIDWAFFFLSVDSTATCETI